MLCDFEYPLDLHRAPRPAPRRLNSTHIQSRSDLVKGGRALRFQVGNRGQEVSSTLGRFRRSHFDAFNVAFRSDCLYVPTVATQLCSPGFGSR